VNISDIPDHTIQEKIQKVITVFVSCLILSHQSCCGKVNILYNL